MKKNQRYSIEGMQCADCENAIEAAVLALPGVKNANSDFTTETLELNFDPNTVSIKSIKEAIINAGYSCSSNLPKNQSSLARSLINLLLVIITIYLFVQLKNSFALDFSLDQISENANYGLLFMVGVLTSFHCVGMCGGFVLSYSVAGAKSGQSSHLSHFYYALGKMLSYTGFGALFGLVGAIFSITTTMTSIVSGLAGLFLIMYGLSMMDAFAKLRRFHIRLPRVLVQHVFKKQHSTNNPLIIGLLNGLMIACGPLQAMYILAAGTGNAMQGAKLLAFFGLGTLPLMLSLGYLANKVTANTAKQFTKISGIVIVVLGAIMLNRGMLLRGTGYDFNSLMTKAVQKINGKVSLWQNEYDHTGSYFQNGYQVIYMEVEEDQYIPAEFSIRKNVPVKWVINVKALSECSKQINLPTLDKAINLNLGLQLIEFNPTADAMITWSCHMGMIPGNFSLSD